MLFRSGIVYGEVKSFTTPAYDFDLDNDLVDLGLSVKWARFNVGAKSETGLLIRFHGFQYPSHTLFPVQCIPQHVYGRPSECLQLLLQSTMVSPFSIFPE